MRLNFWVLLIMPVLTNGQAYSQLNSQANSFRPSSPLHYRSPQNRFVVEEGPRVLTLTVSKGHHKHNMHYRRNKVSPVRSSESRVGSQSSRIIVEATVAPTRLHDTAELRSYVSLPYYQRKYEPVPKASGVAQRETNPIFLNDLNATTTSEQKVKYSEDSYLHSNLVQEEYQLRRQLKRTTVGSVNYLQLTTAIPKPETTTKITTTVAQLQTISKRTPEIVAVTTLIPPTLIQSSSINRQSSVAPYVKKIVVPELKRVHSAPALSVSQFVIQPSAETPASRQVLVPSAMPLPPSTVSVIERIPSENAVAATNNLSSGTVDGNSNRDDTLGCAWDIVTNSCKDLFNLGWCVQCYDFGNIFLHNCKCVTKTSQVVTTFV